MYIVYTHTHYFVLPIHHGGMTRGNSENWIKGWFALLPWPWWPIEIFPEVTVSDHLRTMIPAINHWYIYIQSIYIYLYNWMMITYDHFHMGFPFIPIHHCDTWICDMCFALFILKHPIGTRRSPVVFVDLEAPWILYYHNCHTSQLLELYINLAIINQL